MHSRGTLLPRHWLQRWVFCRYKGIALKETRANVWWIHVFALVVDFVFYCWFVCVPVDGAWTPWSVWSDCSVTCGHGTQIRTHACINPPPRNNGSDCLGPERETKDCPTLPCLGLFTDFFCYSSSSCTGTTYSIQSTVTQLRFVDVIDGIGCRWSLSLGSMVIMFPKLWRGFSVTASNVSVRSSRWCNLSSWDRGREKQTGASAVLQKALPK